MTLTGRVQGKTRDDLISQATTEARTYYDTNCVSIQLSDEKAQTDYIDTGDMFCPDVTAGAPTYTANYQADIKHRWERPAYGFPICRLCKIEDYSGR